jgi:hypothetical protein
VLLKHLEPESNSFVAQEQIFLSSADNVYAELHLEHTPVAWSHSSQSAVFNLHGSHLPVGA